MERCHSFKDKVAKGISSNLGLFSYPVLMASDILIYKSDLVPVGRDQKQHLEVTRDIATRFNSHYGDILIIPKELTQAAVSVIPGVDGQKMSKSYNNTIEIFGAEKAMRKKIMKIVTDSTPVEQPKNPDSCSIFALYTLFADVAEVEGMRRRYLEGGMGYGTAKQELFEKYWEYFRPMRQRRDELNRNLGYVQDILEKGAQQAKNLAAETLSQVRKAVGI